MFLGFINATTIDKKANAADEVSLPKFVDFNIPYLQKDFVGFKEALAFKESQGKYTAVNTLGYLGKYQFGRTTLERFRIYNTQAFLRNPELQERAFIALCKVNKWILRKDIKRSVGKTINGIKITESGILAAAHLSGAGNVKKFLRSNGAIRFADAYGATIQYYMKKFGGYNVSNIKADRKAKVIS
ncbi:peptidoglycan-binding protein LysM [Polaribacter septentrionalilitoris]|uniref:peptidoglycan-binding protein LysM n=1 Tax=Polaribacter septentrionalilitoris TaxID=2494657 RepID=UPI0013575D79|nr:peptidoglycan-binding protein LysM [Polaribacter septentrionalilitoris]